MQIPTYFIDKDTTPPAILNFHGFWQIEDMLETNTIEFQFIEKQSGIKRVGITGSGAHFNHMTINNTITIELIDLVRVSERRFEGKIFIELEDNKGNSNLYELYIYHNLPYDPPEYSNSTFDTDNYIVPGILLLAFVGILIVRRKKR